jgi:hypothetical protein
MGCTKCVVPDNYPGVEFDADGVCNFCRAHEASRYLGRPALEEALAASTTGPDGRPHVIVPVSGGKDSTYVLYYLVKELGVHATAMNYDGGFTHPDATANLRQMTDRLGVELVTVKRDHQRRLMVGNLRAYLARPKPSMVPLMCTGCRIGIVGSACQVAKERGVDTIVMGWSHIEEAPFKANSLKEDGGSVLRGLVKNVLQNPRYLLQGGPITQVADYVHSYARVRDWGRPLQMLYPGLRHVSFFDYIDYDPENVQRTVTREVGWTSPDPENSWRFDCTIKLLLGHLYRSAWGFTADHDYLSAKIREGYITREQALAALEKSEARTDEAFEELSAMLTEVGAADLIPKLAALPRAGAARA